MIKSNITQIKIAGISAAVSTKWTSLAELATTEETALVEKFIKKTGVTGRYNAGLHQTTSDFCYAAAKRLLAEKQINLKDIGVLVFVTQSADYKIPATACLLQSRLGLSKDCMAFDVNLGCSGFTYGINIVASLLKTSNAKKALLLAGDTAAKERSHKLKTKVSHSAGMLFGDCGTATLLEISDNCEPIRMISKTDGEGFKAIIAPYGWWRNPDAPTPEQFGTSVMDDIAVFNFAVNEAPALIKDTMALSTFTPNDYDCLVLHQANLFILKQIAKRTGFAMEKTLLSLDKFGNTSSASIPVSLVNKYGFADDRKQLHIMSCGFGVGLSWSTVDFYINTNDILPLIQTDDYFDDGYEIE